MQVCKIYDGSRPEVGIAELRGCVELAQRLRVNLEIHAPAASRTISIANTCANHAAPCRSSITQYRLSLHSEASSSASASRLAKLKRTGWISE